MTTRSLWPTILFFAVACLVVVPAPAQAQSGSGDAEELVALRAGMLLDVESGELTRDVVVLVRGERIEAVGQQVEVPAGATTIDLGDTVLMPGPFRRTHARSDSRLPGRQGTERRPQRHCHARQPYPQQVGRLPHRRGGQLLARHAGGGLHDNP